MVHEQHKSHLYLWKELKYPVWRNNPSNLRAFAHGTEQLWTVGETAGLQREPQNVNMHVNMNYEGRRRSIIVSGQFQQCQSTMFLTSGGKEELFVPISHAARVEVGTAALLLTVPSCFLQAENIYNDEEPDNTPASELEAQGS